MNDEAVYRTAPATPGLLNTFSIYLIYVVGRDFAMPGPAMSWI